jgi:hypothetical protein
MRAARIWIGNTVLYLDKNYPDNPAGGSTLTGSGLPRNHCICGKTLGSHKGDVEEYGLQIYCTCCEEHTNEWHRRCSDQIKPTVQKEQTPVTKKWSFHCNIAIYSSRVGERGCGKKREDESDVIFYQKDKKKKVKQSRYRPGVAQRVPGS